MHGTSNAKLLDAQNILDRLIRMIGSKQEYHEVSSAIESFECVCIHPTC